MTGAELEFTFLSISQRYKPYKEIMSALFYRTLSMIGVEYPRAFATNVERVSVYGDTRSSNYALEPKTALPSCALPASPSLV